MKLALTANPQKPAAVRLAQRLLEVVGDRAEIVLAEETAQRLGGQHPSAPLEKLEGDLLVAIGGDGTFLHALHRCRLPLFPVNAGTVGFLAEIDGEDVSELESSVNRLVEGQYTVEQRMMLATEAPPHTLPDAVNEVVVHTSQVAKMRLFELSLDGRPVGRIRADGVVIATPTGSTSYSLSALGPIIDPTVEGIVITALAPFQATQRAVVVDPLRTVTVQLVHAEKEGVVVIDGQNEFRLSGGSRVRVFRSASSASFVRLGSGFFQRLRGKKILPWSEDAPESGGPSNAPVPSDS